MQTMKRPFFSATRCTTDFVPAYKSFLHRTRFLILLLVILLNTVVHTNTLLINFAVICMSEENIELVLNGSHHDYELLRHALALSLSDFRSTWFTFSPVQRILIFTMGSLGSLIAMYPTWLAIMKYGYRRVCSTACLASTFLTAFLPWCIFFGLPFVVCAQFLLGATAPSAMLLVPSVIRKWSTRKNDHFCFLVLTTFQQISPAILYPIAAYLSKTSLGWPVVFYFQSIFSFIITIAFFYFYKETPARHANVSDNELEKIRGSEAVRGNIDYMKMLLCPQFQSVCCSIVAYFLILSFFVQYLPSYLYDIMEQPLEKTAWTVSLVMIGHLILKIFVSRIFERNPLLTNIYTIKFMAFASCIGPALIMVTLFITKFHFDIQLILFAAIFALLSLSWPSIFKSSNIISNKYYLPVMVRTHTVLFYSSLLVSNLFPLIFGRHESWNCWRYNWLILAAVLIGSAVFFWLTFKFNKSDWDVAVPVEPPPPTRPEDIAPVSHPRPCRYSTSFDDEIVVSIISRGLDRCDTCKKHGLDVRVHPSSEHDVIPTRKMFDELVQSSQEESITMTRF